MSSASLGAVKVYYSKVSGRISNIVITQQGAELATGIRIGADIRDVLKANGLSRPPTEKSWFELNYRNRSRAYAAFLILQPDNNALIKRIDIGNAAGR